MENTAPPLLRRSGGEVGEPRNLFPRFGVGERFAPGDAWNLPSEGTGVGLFPAGQSSRRRWCAGTRPFNLVACVRMDDQTPMCNTTSAPQPTTTTTTTSVAILAQVVGHLFTIGSDSVSFWWMGTHLPVPTFDDAAASLGTRLRKWQRSRRWDGTILCLAATMPLLLMGWWSGFYDWNESWNRSGVCFCRRS